MDLGGGGASGRQAFEMVVVGPVHSQDQIEVLEVVEAHLATSATDIEASAPPGSDHRSVRGLSDVPVGGPRRLDLHSHTTSMCGFLESRRRSWGTTDVSQTDCENANRAW